MTPSNDSREKPSATAVRKLSDLSASRFDLVIVGGGIYGIMTALEAVRRQLRPLLIERGRIAGATSRNSLKIVHGGFRYLQSIDLPRFFESVRERRWFLRHFPDLVRPLPCLMPYYGDGLRRRSILTGALAVNDVLTVTRNSDVAPDRHLPRGRMISADEASRIFPAVDRRGLQGAAIWYDAMMKSDEEVAAAALHWAEESGAIAVAGVEAVRLVEECVKVTGIVAREVSSGCERTIRAARVVNATGPWAGELAAASDRVFKRLSTLSLAWNLVFRRPPLSDHGIAVTARRRGAQTYFAVPWRDRLMIGTGHAPWRGGADGPQLADETLQVFIDEINLAVSELALKASEVEAQLVGLLPAVSKERNTLTRRPALIDHGAGGGPRGLFSVSGIKFTTARAVADSLLSRAFPSRRPTSYDAFSRRAAQNAILSDGMESIRS